MCHTICNAGSRGGVVVRVLASHQCGPGFHSPSQPHMWFEFVVGSLLALRMGTGDKMLG